MSTVQLLVFASALTAFVYCACPSEWREYSGSCYKFQTDTEDWPSARQMCKWHNSDLIAIETQAEQQWFHQQALTFNHTDRDNGFWIGASNFENDGNWMWQKTQKPFAYKTWGQDQPNNRNNSELCLAALKLFDYTWSDEFCSWKALQYVCEMGESTAPVVG